MTFVQQWIELQQQQSSGINYSSLTQLFKNPDQNSTEYQNRPSKARLV